MRKYMHGIYHLKHPEKYVGDPNHVVFRSSWERRLTQFLDEHPAVTKFASEEVAIPYFSQADQKMRRYFVDYIVQVKLPDGMLKNYMIEVKPYSQTIQPTKGRKKMKTYLTEIYEYQVNQDKWKAAREYAKKHDMEFKILTEYDLGLKQWHH